MNLPAVDEPGSAPGYGAIFDQRGSAYAEAMARWPAAREAEFAALFESTPVLAGQSVLDVPAGGGYLRARIPQAHVTQLEFSDGFGHAVDADATVPVVSPAGPWPRELCGPFDHAICLAALHHIREGDELVRRLLGTLKPGGVLHMADVPANSPVADFLDNFVGRYNLTGHSGRYRAADMAAWNRMGRVRRCQEQVVPWRFVSDADMLAFTAGLFGVRDCPAHLLMRALEKVGVLRDSEGVQLHWRLWYVDLSPRSSRRGNAGV